MGSLRTSLHHPVDPTAGQPELTDAMIVHEPENVFWLYANAQNRLPEDTAIPLDMDLSRFHAWWILTHENERLAHLRSLRSHQPEVV